MIDPSFSPTPQGHESPQYNCTECGAAIYESGFCVDCRLGARNRSYHEQIPTCECDFLAHISPQHFPTCDNKARYSVIRDGKRTYVCIGCIVSADTGVVDLLSNDLDTEVRDWL